MACGQACGQGQGRLTSVGPNPERADTMSTGAKMQKPAEKRTFADAFDVERIRADFPILYREVYGKPLVYLDNGASAQKPRTVLEAMDHAYRFEYANVHRGLHYLSNAATQRFEDARETA